LAFGWSWSWTWTCWLLLAPFDQVASSGTASAHAAPAKPLFKALLDWADVREAAGATLQVPIPKNG
jgi:hypothetical protein